MGSGSVNDKFNKFTELREKKIEIVDSINAYNDTLKSIELAKKLDQKLPEKAKQNNTIALELKKEYDSFFLIQTVEILLLKIA
jgi:hypothetical protein